MKAKPTRYKGFSFSSRLEARYAYFFDLMQVKWVYEPEAYDLDGLTYIPDFWLPTLRVWLEVKGEIISDEIGLKIMEKAGRLAALSGSPVVLTFDDPLEMKCVTFGVRGGVYTRSSFELCPHCGALGLCVWTEERMRFLCPEKDGHGEPLPIKTTRQLHRTFYDMAMAARQKKFGIQRKAS